MNNGNPEKVFIITGASRGIGEALARTLIDPSHHVICLSRNHHPRLQVEAHAKKCKFDDIAIDLSDLEKLQDVLTQIFRGIHRQNIQSITLVNNAGTIHPIRKIGAGGSFERIRRAMNVNLASAMFITDAFVHETREMTCVKRVLNLSSGAAYRPVEGWSAYCVAKAGLYMYSRCLAEEQSTLAHPVKVVSFAPGVVDTEMQAEIRQSASEDFPELHRFKAMKEEGALLSPEHVAEAIKALIENPSFGDTLEMDIRNMPKK